tara:strand:- start:826 stop:1011 length:186 start_codon:yes stop_codon:yes gene_type:complete
MYNKNKKGKNIGILDNIYLHAANSVKILFFAIKTIVESNISLVTNLSVLKVDEGIHSNKQK